MKTSFAAVTGVFLVLLGSLTNLFGQSDAEARAADITKALVNGHRAWRSKMSTPGAFVKVTEVERKGSVVRYSLQVIGLPTDELYTVMSWPVGQGEPSTVIEGVSVGQNGTVMCAGRIPDQCGDASKRDDPVDFVFNPAKGEPYRIALIAGGYRATVVIVPDPITTTDKGCTLSVERLMPKFELAYITGSGFPPNTEASFDSESHGERRQIKQKVDNDGNLDFALLPFVAGHKSGTTTIKGVGMKFSPTVGFDWGD